MNKYLSKTFKTAKKYMKNVQHDLLIIREMHLRTIAIYYLTPVRMAKVKPQKGNAQQNVEKREHFCPCWWEYVSTATVQYGCCSINEKQNHYIQSKQSVRERHLHFRVY